MLKYDLSYNQNEKSFLMPLLHNGYQNLVIISPECTTNEPLL